MTAVNECALGNGRSGERERQTLLRACLPAETYLQSSTRSFTKEASILFCFFARLLVQAIMMMVLLCHPKVSSVSVKFLDKFCICYQH